MAEEHLEQAVVLGIVATHCGIASKSFADAKYAPTIGEPALRLHTSDGVRGIVFGRRQWFGEGPKACAIARPV
jgi:hypothetical protein